MIDAYNDTISGNIPADQMPDIRDTFLPEARDTLYRPSSNLNGRGILIQICSQCHNSSTNPALSRANFNVDQLDALPQIQKDLAIERLMMPAGDIRKMPPDQFYDLSDSERQMLIDELSR